MSNLEVITNRRPEKAQIKAAIFDFDGTISTLRCGWEKVMRPLMLEMIGGGRTTAELEEKVDRYIDQSTGIQTIYQMRWLAEQAEAAGTAVEGREEWWYKEEYNRRLMEQVSVRLTGLRQGKLDRRDFLITGAEEFLDALSTRGVELYLASGTDHCDVVREVAALGLTGCFRSIKGAPEHQAACSKEAVIRMILEEKHLSGEELFMVGDGKVEIALGVENGAFTLGTATNEESRQGVNPVKRERLLKAGADAVVGDFQNSDSILQWLML